MIKKNFSVLIPDGESTFALPVLRCLAQVKDITVHVLSCRKWPPARYSIHRKQFFKRDRIKEDKKRAGAMADYAEKCKADVILPVDTDTIRLLSIYKDHFPDQIPIAALADTKDFDTASDKGRLAQFLKKNNLNSPKTILFESTPKDFQNFSAVPFPVLVKPTQGGYGEGIEFFSNSSALSKYLRKKGKPGKTIIQSYIKGYDTDCSVLTQNGKVLAYTIQKGFIAGYRRFGSPVGVDFIHDINVFDLVSQLMAHLNWNGIAHIDLRYDENGQTLNIIEINPRYWGSLLGSLVAGVNFPYLACLNALGETFQMPIFEERRFVAGKAAGMLLFQKLRNWNKSRYSTQNTPFHFIARDPFPELFNFIRKIRKK